MDTTALLNRLIQKKDLTADEANEFLTSLMHGEVSPVQAGGILVALRMKGETTEEIVGFVKAMRSHMIRVDAKDAIDVVGTGGDGSGTFNISTAAALVVAGAGVPVAKHGNRAASSLCGSADVLEALGVNINLTKEQAERVFKAAGIVFLFAPLFHPALKQVVAVRKELKIRTIFNILGPFANPASTERQLVGVPNRDIAQKLADVARILTYKHLLIVTSEDSTDEISIFSKTHVFELKGKARKKYVIDPAAYGFKKPSKKDILGGSAQENAQIIRDTLDGEKGAKRDVVILNSAFALLVAGVVKNPEDGIRMAEMSIDSGAARKSLEKLVRESSAVRV